MSKIENYSGLDSSAATYFASLTKALRNALVPDSSQEVPPGTYDLHSMSMDEVRSAARILSDKKDAAQEENWVDVGAIYARTAADTSPITTYDPASILQNDAAFERARNAARTTPREEPSLNSEQALHFTA